MCMYVCIYIGSFGVHDSLIPKLQTRTASHHYHHVFYFLLFLFFSRYSHAPHIDLFFFSFPTYQGSGPIMWMTEAMWVQYISQEHFCSWHGWESIWNPFDWRPTSSTWTWLWITQKYSACVGPFCCLLNATLQQMPNKNPQHACAWEKPANNGHKSHIT